MTTALSMADGTDLVAELSVPIAGNAMATFLGLDARSATEVLPILDRAGQLLDPAGASHDDDARAIWLVGLAFFRTLIRDSRGSMGVANHLGQLVRDGVLSEPDAAINAFMFAHAAYENSRNLLSLAAIELLEGDASLRTRLAEPGILDDLIRRLSPARTVARFASAPGLIGTANIGSSTKVLVSIGDANQSLPSPHHRHLAFGAGRHSCPGASYARAEVSAALRGLADRVGEATFEIRTELADSVVFHGPSSAVIRTVRPR